MRKTAIRIVHIQIFSFDCCLNIMNERLTVIPPLNCEPIYATDAAVRIRCMDSNVTP